jgi:hypothetical protein
MPGQTRVGIALRDDDAVRTEPAYFVWKPGFLKVENRSFSDSDVSVGPTQYPLPIR